MVIKDALTKFSEFCSSKHLVGHNINYAMRYVQKECEINGIPFFFKSTDGYDETCKEKT